MRWRCVRAFGPGTLPVAADDLSRVVEDVRGLAIVLANASSAPFELFAPALSRAMIEAAIAAWRTGASPAEAIEQARQVVLASGPEAAGSMLFASLGDEVEIAWVGPEEARQLVGTTVVTRTMPHSLQALHGPTVPDVPTRVLGSERGVPDMVRWDPHANTRLVFANPSVARVDFGTAMGAATMPDLQAAADELIAAAVQVRADRAAVVVLAERP